MSSDSVFNASVLTLFPEMFPGPLGCSLAGKALENNIWSLDVVNLREHAHDKHAMVDDRPYGGGVGMVMKADVIDNALQTAKATLPNARIIYTSPRGRPLDQPLVEDIKNQDAIILCGRFEGVDQRVIDHHEMLEVSLGDFVLSGGEVAAMAILDACVRLLPGVIAKDDAKLYESFTLSSEYAGLLEYPHYTRPSFWKGQEVPDILLSGNHKEIDSWRLEQAKLVTKTRRPDIWAKFVKGIKE